ncbi:MAG: response regulator [Lachnospiraceae bacterium]|nr:response regulator [Lachnospiraceae bacterium]
MKNANKIFDGIVAYVSVYVVAILLFCAAITIYYFNVDERVYIGDHEYTYIEEWLVRDGDGNEFTTGRFYRADHRYYKPFTIITTLPDNIKDNSILCFITSYDTYVYINDELRKDFIGDRDMPLPGGPVMAFYMTVPVDSSDSGATLRLEKRGYSNRPTLVTETFITDMAGVYGKLMEEYGLSLGISMVILFFALVVLIISIFMRLWYKRRIDMLYGALGILVVCAWLVTNSYLYPFVFGHYHVYGVVNYIFCLIMPIELLHYLDALQEGRYRKLMSVLMVLCILNSLFWMTLHFTGILALSKALIPIDVVLSAVVLVVIIVLAVDIKKGYAGRYRYTAIGFAGILVSAILEIIVLLFTNIRNDSIPMLIGLAWLLNFVVVQQIDFLRKVSEEKQTAIALSEAKTKFLANMSHEIRTPINSILGMNEMVLRENRDPVIEEYSETIRNSGRMLLSLVNDVLDFSKIEAGRLEITKAGYSLCDLIRNVEGIITESAGEKNLTYQSLIEENVPDGQISDEFRIKQVLINLLSNAVKYTDKGGIQMHVYGEYRDEDEESAAGPVYELHFDISDTGRGIRSEDQATLFDAFSRADIGKNRSIEGTGLGLAIVRSIIDSMSGSIFVESEYGKGSVFKVMIPVTVTDKTSVSKIISGLSEKKQTVRDELLSKICDYTAPEAKVLAVDDNAANLTIVKLFLKRTRIVPDMCTNGNEAVKLSCEKAYDLILLDHMMPSPDGIETLKLIRTEKDSLNKDTPAIVLTANAIEGSRQMYMTAGFEDCLTKPLDSTMLEKTVKKYLPEDKIVPVEPLGGQGEKRSEGSSCNDILEFAPADNTDDTDEKSAGAEAEKYDSLKDLSVDVEGGIDYCKGDVTLYEELLEAFLTDSSDRKENLRSAYENRDNKLYSVHVHAIKNSAWMIGAHALSEKAKTLEEASKSDDNETVERLHPGFYEEYVKLIDGVTEIKA